MRSKRYKDKVVIVSEDGTADIAAVTRIDEAAIYAASATRSYAIPRADTRAYVGPAGRIYILAADADYVRDTERLAELERAIVLRQITSYAPAQSDGSQWRLRDIVLYVIIFVLILGLIFK